jgi:hypothetical protein
MERRGREILPQRDGVIVLAGVARAGDGLLQMLPKLLLTVRMLLGMKMVHIPHRSENVKVDVKRELRGLSRVKTFGFALVP